MTVRDRINEYLVIKKCISEVKTNKQRIALMEMLYEKYDEAFSEELRLSHYGSNKDTVKKLKKRQKSMLRHITNLKKKDLGK